MLWLLRLLAESKWGEGFAPAFLLRNLGGYAPATSCNQDFYKCKVAWFQVKMQCKTPSFTTVIRGRLHADLRFPLTVRHLPCTFMAFAMYLYGICHVPLRYLPSTSMANANNCQTLIKKIVITLLLTCRLPLTAGLQLCGCLLFKCGCGLSQAVFVAAKAGG